MRQWAHSIEREGQFARDLAGERGGGQRDRVRTGGIGRTTRAKAGQGKPQPLNLFVANAILLMYRDEGARIAALDDALSRGLSGRQLVRAAIMLSASTSSPGTRLLTVQQWTEQHPWPPLGGLRSLIFHAQFNGFDAVVRRVGRRVLIDERAFFEWVDRAALRAQPKGRRQPPVQRKGKPAARTNSSGDK